MKLSIDKKWYEKDWARLLFAIVLNVAVLAVMLCCFEVRYEENDDLTVQKFLDGQTAVKTPFVVYINYFLALFIKWLYDICDNSLPMFPIFQYALLLISFTGVSYLLFKRLNAVAAVAGSMAVLCFFGADSYMIMTYTKTAGIATAGGVSLMLLGMNEEGGLSRWLPFGIGTVVLLFSLMLRDKEFLACGALMLPLGLWCFVCFVMPKAKKLKAAGKFVLPFVLVLVIGAGLYAANEYIWVNSEYEEYREYNAERSRHGDYGVPDYDQMPEVYDSVYIDQNAIDMSGFYDTEKWTKEVIATVADARDEIVTKPSWGECLGTFLDSCIANFFLQRHIYGLLAVLLLWCCCGKRDKLSFATVLLSFAAFGVLYLALIHKGRYMVNRTDVGFFFALAVTLLWFLDRDKAKRENIFCLLLLCLCLGWGYRQNREYCYFYSENYISDDSAEKAAIELLLEDEEHIFLTGIGGVNHTLYSPLETVPAGYSDKIVLLGDWCVMHPNITAILAKYDIVNPYKDVVNSEKAYLVVDDIDVTMKYINEYYYPDAVAELVEPLSQETGLLIYKVSTEDGT